MAKRGTFMKVTKIAVAAIVAIMMIVSTIMVSFPTAFMK